MNIRKAIIFSVVAFLSYAPNVWACDFCALHIGATPFEFNKTGIRVDTRVASGNEVYIDGAKSSNDSQLDGQFITSQITGFYRVTKNMTLSLMVPQIDRTEKHLTGHAHEDEADAAHDADANVAAAPEEVGHADEHDAGEEHHAAAKNSDDSVGVKEFKTQGVGDMVLMSNYIVYNNVQNDTDKATKFGFQFGVKLPTGSTSEKTDGEQAEMHLQPGTGSYDILAGGMGQYRAGAFSLYGDMLYKYNSAGARNYRFGNAVNANLTGKYQVWPFRQFSENRAFVLLALNGEWSAYDKELGKLVEDSGGKMIMASPGINLFIKNNIVIEAIYQKPIYRSYNGSEDAPQVVTSEKFIVGLQYLF